VLTTYNSKTYKIDEIAWERSASQSFPMRDGSQCSFIQYYEDVYLSTLFFSSLCNINFFIEISIKNKRSFSTSFS
jgi:hypothetical protein